MNEATQSILTDLKMDRGPLVIVFSGLGDEFEFRRTLMDIAVNAIYIRDLSHRWCLYGIRGIGDSVPSVAVFLRTNNSHGPRLRCKRIGNSTGIKAGTTWRDTRGIWASLRSICARSCSAFPNNTMYEY